MAIESIGLIVNVFYRLLRLVLVDLASLRGDRAFVALDRIRGRGRNRLGLIRLPRLENAGTDHRNADHVQLLPAGTGQGVNILPQPGEN